MDAPAPSPDLAPEAADWWFDTASAKAVAGFCAVAAVAISSVQVRRRPPPPPPPSARPLQIYM